jgi:hypothetical protein
MSVVWFHILCRLVGCQLFLQNGWPVLLRPQWGQTPIPVNGPMAVQIAPHHLSAWGFSVGSAALNYGARKVHRVSKLFWVVCRLISAGKDAQLYLDCHKNIFLTLFLSHPLKLRDTLFILEPSAYLPAKAVLWAGLVTAIAGIWGATAPSANVCTAQADIFMRQVPQCPL